LVGSYHGDCVAGNLLLRLIVQSFATRHRVSAIEIGGESFGFAAIHCWSRSTAHRFDCRFRRARICVRWSTSFAEGDAAIARSVSKSTYVGHVRCRNSAPDAIPLLLYPFVVRVGDGFLVWNTVRDGTDEFLDYATGKMPRLRLAEVDPGPCGATCGPISPRGSGRQRRGDLLIRGGFKRGGCPVRTAIRRRETAHPASHRLGPQGGNTPGYR
jgi:hypothetical protein